MIEAEKHEKEGLPPYDHRLQKAYVLLLEGIFNVTRLNELAASLATQNQESATEVARASLVMGGACLDATMKQAIRDALLSMASFDGSVQQRLAKMIGRRLKRDLDKDGELLASLVAWPEGSRDQLLEELVAELTSASLQSVQQLSKVHGIFGMGFQATETLQKALDARNQVVHEMDVLNPMPEVKYGKDGKFVNEKHRRPRDLAELDQWSREMLDTAHQFIRKVDKRFGELIDYTY